MHRKDGPANSDTALSFYGMAAYSRIAVSNILIKTVNIIGFVIFRISNIAAPKCATMENFKMVFDHIKSVISLHEPTIVMSDFNQDLFKES